jgi:hypothetical protein
MRARVAQLLERAGELSAAKEVSCEDAWWKMKMSLETWGITNRRIRSPQVGGWSKAGILRRRTGEMLMYFLPEVVVF